MADDANSRSNIFDAACAIGAGVDDGAGGALSGFRVRLRGRGEPIGRGVGAVFVVDGRNLCAQSGEGYRSGSVEQ